MAVFHVGINFEFPSVGAECSTYAGGESRLESFLHPAAAGIHECFEAELALLFAWCLVGRSITAEAQSLLVHDEIDVLRETVDEFPRLGK